MNYKEARQYITEKEGLGSVFGLDSIRELLRRLGNPEKGRPAIHIAGTNGKGSILAYVEETLVQAGLNVGRYISPTIYDYRERWKHSKEWASEAEVAETITEVASVVDEMISDGLPSPTAFEIETAVTFLLFKKWNVDVMLIECGMGGLLDATNVIEADVINVLASISRDHMQILGNTLTEITTQKLGIVRDGSVLISYPQVDEVKCVIDKYCTEHDVKLINVDSSEIEVLESDYGGSHFTYKGEEYSTALGGVSQIYNATVAIEVIREFFKGYIRNSENGITVNTNEDVTDDVTGLIKMGLSKTEWDGRFSVVMRNPLVIVDGAHNEDAWMRLRDSLDKYFTNQKFVFIIGVLRDKEYHKMIDILGPVADYVYAIQSDSPRALTADELRDDFAEAGVETRSCGLDLEQAAEKALERAKKNGETVVVCGTLTISGEMIKCIKSMQS